MFSVSLFSINNDNLLDRFKDTIAKNTICPINKTEPDFVFIIAKSIDDNTSIYSDASIINDFKEKSLLRDLKIAIISSLSDNEYKSILDKIDILSCPYIVVLEAKNKYISNEIIDFICLHTLKHFDVDTLFDDIIYRNLNKIENVQSVINTNFNVITDSNGETILLKTKGLDTINPATVTRSSGSKLFLVRKKFRDSNSEILQTMSLQKAVTECNKHTGYHVYNEYGIPIHESTKSKVSIVKHTSPPISGDNAIIRTGNGLRFKTQSGEIMSISDGERVKVTKIFGDKIEINIFKNGNQYKTYVRPDVLTSF